MKKRIMNMLLFLALGGTAMAQTVTVADVEVLPGTTASYALVINVGGGKYSGFQYEIAFPATGFSTPETGKSTVNASWEGGSINPGALTEGAGRVSVLSMTNTQLPDGDFAVGTVSFEVASDVTVGEYDVTISNFEFLSGTTRTAAPDVTFKVTVTDRITLDEESTELPATMAGVNVKVKRTLKADVWNTICLPFSMDETQLKAAFGDDVELGYFDGYDANGSDITVSFAQVEAADGMEANQPYLVKVSSAITSFNVDGVDVEADEEGAFIRVGGTKSNPKSLFTGTLRAGTIVPADYLYLSDNKFYYSTGTTTIKGFRGYFFLKDFDSSAGTPVLNFEVDGQVTKVDGIQVVTNDGTYYNLNGMKTDRPTKKGVYIRDGKKVVIK